MDENDTNLDSGWNTPETGLSVAEAKKPEDHISGIRQTVQEDAADAARSAPDAPAIPDTSDTMVTLHPPAISVPPVLDPQRQMPTQAPEAMPEHVPKPASVPAPAEVATPAPAPKPVSERIPVSEPTPEPALETPAYPADLAIPPPPPAPVLSIRPPEHFDADTGQAILVELLAQRETEEIAKMQQDPENIDPKSFYLLSAEGQAQVAVSVVVAKGMDYLTSKFPAYIPGTIFASNLFETGIGEQVAFHLGIFKNLVHAVIADALISQGKGWAVASSIENFKDIDHKQILLKLLKAGQRKAVTQNIAAFSKFIDQEAIFELINAGCPGAAASVLPSLRNLGIEIAHDLIKNGCSPAVAKNIKSFSPNAHNEIAMLLVEAGMTKDFGLHIRQFIGLDKAIALSLIESGNVMIVASEISLFPAADHNEIACELLAADRASLLDICFRHFRELEKDTALRLIRAGYITGICESMDSIKNIDEELTREIIYAAKKLGVNPPMRELILKLIDLGKGELVLSLFTDAKLFDEEIYRKLIEAGHFEELSKKVGAHLLERKFFPPRQK